MRSIQTFILSLVFSLLCVNAFSRSSNDSILIPLEEIVNIEENGGSIIISNDALIEIREQGGNLNLENGAILNYIKGTIL